MHDVENRGVDADTERDGHDDDQRIARRSPESSCAAYRVPVWAVSRILRHAARAERGETLRVRCASFTCATDRIDILYLSSASLALRTTRSKNAPT